MKYTSVDIENEWFAFPQKNGHLYLHRGVIRWHNCARAGPQRMHKKMRFSELNCAKSVAKHHQRNRYAKHSITRLQNPVRTSKYPPNPDHWHLETRQAMGHRLFWVEKSFLLLNVPKFFFASDQIYFATWLHCPCFWVWLMCFLIVIFSVIQECNGILMLLLNCLPTLDKIELVFFQQKR